MAEVTVHLVRNRHELPEGVVHLTLTMREARVVKDLTDLVCGNTRGTTREHSDAVSDALERAGFRTASCSTPESAFRTVDIDSVPLACWDPQFHG